MSSGYVSTQISDAEAHLGAGDTREAEAELKAAISNATQLGDSTNVSRAAVDLATVQDRDGEYFTALHTLEEALPSVASPDARATILNNKALTLLHIGRLSEAADTARQAFAVLQSFNSPGTVPYLNLASILTLAHNPVEAMKLLLALKPALEKQPNTREWATLNDVLGSTFIEVFDAKAAADAYRAEKAVGKTLGDHKIVAAAEIGLAVAALQLSDGATARIDASDALDELKYVQDAFLEIQARLIVGIAGEADSNSRRANLVRLNELAKLRQQDLISSEALLMLAYMSKDLGQEDQALKYCDEAYPSAHRIGNEQMQGFVAGVRASIYAQLHQYDRAEPLFDEAIAAAETLRSTSSLTFRFTLDDFVRNIFDDAIDQAIEAKHFARAFEIAEEGKAKLLVEGLKRATAGQTPDFLAEEEKLIERLEEFESERRILAQSSGSEPRMATLSAQIAATERAHQDLMLRASLQAPARAILFDSRRPRVADLQKQIAPDTTVISYVFCSKALAIFAVTHSSFLSVTVPKVSRELVQRQMQDFRAFGDLTTRPDVLSELYAELIDPISQGIRTSRVVIVPDGIVRFVPFAALHSGRDYFGVGRSIGLLSSAKLLTIKTQGPRGRQGDLLFTSFSAPRGLPLLKAADHEVRSISSSFGVKERTNVTRSALLSLAPAARILHIAAHARANSLDPTLSKLYLRADQNSGDGTLTVADIEHLALQRNELVVLSACETALSATNRLNDAIGLPEAFLQAGSRTVVSSLWNVDDESTQSFMKWFYAALRSGDGVDIALSKAQAQLRVLKPHPYYWAAFVVMGDFGPVFDSNSSH